MTSADLGEISDGLHRNLHPPTPAAATVGVAGEQRAGFPVATGSPQDESARCADPWSVHLGSVFHSKKNGPRAFGVGFSLVRDPFSHSYGYARVPLTLTKFYGKTFSVVSHAKATADGASSNRGMSDHWSVIR